MPEASDEEIQEDDDEDGGGSQSLISGQDALHQDGQMLSLNFIIFQNFVSQMFLY